jgi:hypothetical protein
MDNVIQLASKEDSDDLFSNLKYICGMTNLIKDSLKRRCHVAQLPNGDVIVTEVKVINTQYCWDRNRSKLIKI